MRNIHKWSSSFRDPNISMSSPGVFSSHFRKVKRQQYQLFARCFFYMCI